MPHGVVCGHRNRGQSRRSYLPIRFPLYAGHLMMRLGLFLQFLVPGVNTHYYHSGAQGTYSRTSLPRLESLASSRKTVSISSFLSSSLAAVLVPSHSDSIQRRFLVLTSAPWLSTILTPRLPHSADTVAMTSQQQLNNLY